MSLGSIARRTFLIGSAAIAGGVAFGAWYVSQPYANPLEGELKTGEATFNPWLKIGSDGAITVVVPRAEMGQGVQTTLAALVAEELGVPLDRLIVEHGPADGAYYNAELLVGGTPFEFYDQGTLAAIAGRAMGVVGRTLGLQVTGGSTSTQDAYDKMRHAGAMAREALAAAASRRLGVERAALRQEGDAFVHPTGAPRVAFGELALEAAEAGFKGEVALKDPAQWTLLGKAQARTDIPAKVTGRAQFGIDVRLPDMLFGTVVMSPRFGARPTAWSEEAALAVKGVRKLVPIDTTYGHGFGIVADTTWAAFKGAEALAPKWADGDYPLDTDAMSAALLKALDAPADFTPVEEGDATIAFADAPREEVVEALYEVPFLAHACLEPMNATAWLREGRLDVFSPNQAPTLTRMKIAGDLGLAEDSVHVHTTLMGGGFGRRGEMDFSLFAAILAGHTDGRPIQVTWSRAEDTRHDMYRPASLARAKARVVKGKGPTAMVMELASTSTVASILKRSFPSLPAGGPDKMLTEGAHSQPVAIPARTVSARHVDLGVPVGFWRSVGNSQNAFFHEAFMDEIAHAAGLDPLAMRLDLMAGQPAATGALRKVAEMSGWGSPAGEGRARGLAFCLSFGAWVAEVVEIAQTPAGVKIEKVWCAVEIGRALDPGIVKAQMMSGIVYGLSAAMNQAITFQDGAVEQSNFHDFPMMRMGQCPVIEVEVLETYGKMGGAGEPGTPPAAPALANAVFALTGTRVRRLPLSREIAFA